MAQTLQPKNTASRLLAVGAIPICDKCLGSWRLHSLQRPGSAGVHVHTDSQHTWKHWDSKTWGTFLEFDFYLLIFHMDRCKGSSQTLVWHFNSSSLTTAQTQTAFPAHKQPSLCLHALTWLRAETLRHTDTQTLCSWKPCKKHLRLQQPDLLGQSLWAVSKRYCWWREREMSSVMLRHHWCVLAALSSSQVPKAQHVQHLSEV